MIIIGGSGGGSGVYIQCVSVCEPANPCVRLKVVESEMIFVTVCSSFFLSWLVQTGNIS